MIIYLDCDGTWIDLYGVNNWLDYLIKENPYPYIHAKPMVHLSTFARTIHQLQKKGIKVGIISWLSKNGSDTYNQLVAQAKYNYFKQHLPSVTFDEIHIIKYGMPKSTCISEKNAILFDDEEKNRKEWQGVAAYSEHDLIKHLKEIAQTIQQLGNFLTSIYINF